MKLGANYSDIRRIKALAAEGHSADEISKIIQVVPECVASFMDRAREDNGQYKADDPETPEDEAYVQPEKPKRKRRTKAEMEAAKAEEAAEE